MQSKSRGIRAKSLELTYGSKALVCRLAWLALLDPNADSIPDDAVRSARTLKEIQLDDNNLKATVANIFGERPFRHFLNNIQCILYTNILS